VARTAAPPARRAGADDRTRQARGRDRRDRIVAEAIRLFAAKGFRGSSIAELAERVGLTHPGLLYYFGTKERLLLDVVHERQDREGDALVAATADGATSVPDTIRAVARFVAEDAVLTRLYVVLGAENLDPGDPLHDFFVTRYDRARRAVAAIAREAGTTAMDADQLGREVVATLMGLEIQWLMDPEAFDYLAAVDAYADSVATRLRG
jgi:AcrR family transcriptional regulator